MELIFLVLLNGFFLFLFLLLLIKFLIVGYWELVKTWNFEWLGAWVWNFVGELNLWLLRFARVVLKINLDEIMDNKMEEKLLDLVVMIGQIFSKQI